MRTVEKHTLNFLKKFLLCVCLFKLIAFSSLANAATNLNYNTASAANSDQYATGWRPYRPDIGRFSSLDPAGSPNGPNRYNYCGSEPVNQSDPTGKYYDENGVWIPAYPGDEPTWRQWFDNILARTHRTADSAAHTVMDPISNFGNNVMMPVAKATTDPIANAGNATGAALNTTIMPVVDSANTFIRENNETITGVTMGVGVTATAAFTGGASIPVMSAAAGSTAATGWTYVLTFFGVKSTAEGAYSTVTGKEAYTGEQLSKTDYAETVTETTFGIVGIGGVAKFSWAKWFGKSRVKTVAETTTISPKVPNPNGKKGGIRHQAHVEDIARDIELRGLRVKFEHRVKLPDGTVRYIDAIAIEPKTGTIVEQYQVGRTTKSGIPVVRERKALIDIDRATTIDTRFVPYDK